MNYNADFKKNSIVACFWEIRMKRIRLALTLPIFMALASCAMPDRSVAYNISVSSFGRAAYAPGTTFAIVAGDEALRNGDPEFLDYAAYLNGVLIDQGLKPAPVETSDLEISLKYGIGEADTRMVGSNSFGSAVAWTKSLSSFASNTSYAYDTTFDRTIQVIAYDLAAYRMTKTWQILWKVQMVSKGHSSDIRMVFPYMLAAGQGYLGMDSGQTENIVILQNDASVQKLRDDSRSLLP